MLKAAIKLSGFLTATRYVWRPFSIIGVDRCKNDGYVVTDSSRSIEAHAGHTMFQPTRLSIFEVILLWIRVIK